MHLALVGRLGEDVVHQDLITVGPADTSRYSRSVR